MKKLKLSQWHDGSVTPVRSGLYERQFLWGVEYCWFDNVWFVYGEDEQDAYYEFYRNNIGDYQKELKWRGVLK